MTHSGARRAWAVGVLAFLCSNQAAWAAVDATKICADGAVDRERLAVEALSQAQVSFYPLHWAERHAQPVGQLSPLLRLLTIANFCQQKVSAGEPPICGEKDVENLEAARTFVNEVLADPRFRKPPGLDAETFLLGRDVRVECPRPPTATELAETPTGPPKQPDLSALSLRLRGSTDGLQFRRTSSQFAGLDKATVTFADDRKARKDTLQVTAIAGLAVPLFPDAEAVPYVGYSIDRGKQRDDPDTPTDEAAATVTKDTLRAGMLLGYRMVTTGGTHYFLLRPEYAGNRKERSEVLTANFAYVPVLGWLNDYAWSIRAPNGAPLLSIMPRGDIRATYGHFGKRGDRLPDDSVDFLRIGSQFGGTLTSDISWLPIDITVLESYLYGVKGKPDELSQFKFVLSASFDAKKYFGVDLSYVRGRPEDLSERTDKWTIGFGAKF